MVPFNTVGGVMLQYHTVVKVAGGSGTVFYP